jgi:hypothetical protein
LENGFLFLPEIGIKTVIIEFTDLGNGWTINKLCLEIGKKIWKIKKKIIALSGDNTNTNFGGILKRGKNNLFTYLNGYVENSIIKIGCLEHILNNAIQSTSNT